MKTTSTFRQRLTIGVGVCVVLLTGVFAACNDNDPIPPDDGDRPLDPTLVTQGKDIFRYDTFGDEVYWTDTLRMNEVIEQGVSPATALKVGLKVDADALPQAVKDAIAAGQVDLNDPATTVTLLKLNAVLGVKGTVATVNGRERLTSLGVTCALCHSKVDDSFAPGIGKRMDG